MFPIASTGAGRMCLYSIFTCCISPLQAGSCREDRGSRTKCAGEGTGGVDVHSTICAQGHMHKDCSSACGCIWLQRTSGVA